MIYHRLTAANTCIGLLIFLVHPLAIAVLVMRRMSQSALCYSVVCCVSNRLAYELKLNSPAVSKNLDLWQERHVSYCTSCELRVIITLLWHSSWCTYYKERNVSLFICFCHDCVRFDGRCFWGPANIISSTTLKYIVMKPRRELFRQDAGFFRRIYFPSLWW